MISFSVGAQQGLCRVSSPGVSIVSNLEEVQEFGLRRSAELLLGRAERIHWYSLFDLPRAWPATTRHRETEGSSYYRHCYLGLLREDGTPKLSVPLFHHYTPELRICQWFHFEDPRLESAVKWLRKPGVRYLSTGISWADSHRPSTEAWFDRLHRTAKAILHFSARNPREAVRAVSTNW